MSRGSPTEEFGPYIVYEQLGVGGMAQVHRAVEMGVEAPRPVALKRMLSHIAGSEDMVRSFVREARLASYLRHDNVAQTYDLGRVGDVYFIVMELITGRNLREVLRHCGKTTGPMPVPIALNILNQICDALDYAHNLCDETGQPLGIIHRDVSPSNVIVSNAGVVKLIDFGIAKASGGGMQTLGGTLKGKFGYMAPEYIAGRLDARADLFAVGVIAHELLTNRPLFSGRDDIDTLTRVRDMHIDPPSKKNPHVPPEIDDVVMTALARDPDRRWQHATALRTAMTTLTHRLGLVASNAQMVQWLDWAFTHNAPSQRDRLETELDTDTDGEPLTEERDSGPESSISIEPRTVQLLAMNQKSTLVMDGGPDGGAGGAGGAGRAPQPPVKTPLGTPAYVPAQRSGPPAPIVDPGSGRAVGPRATTAAIVPPMVRSSSVIPVRPGSPSSPPPIAAARAPSAQVTAQVPSRPSSPSTPPPIAAQPARPSSPSSPPPISVYAGLAQVPASARPAATILSTSAPAPTPVSISRGYAVPSPARPSASAIPIAAPRPARPSSPPPISDPERSAKIQREFAQRVSAPPATAPTTPPRSSSVLAVVLVVLAAAIAAITVYFVLPLLT